MVRRAPQRGIELGLTGVERHFAENQLIVTKTDLKGHITYANPLFVNLSGYTHTHLIGAPHCILRHPTMPASVFKLLWDTIKAEKEVFAYVINRSANGDHYWVFAHVTPSFDEGGQMNGYHSNRRKPKASIIESVITPLYGKIKQAEDLHDKPKDKCQAGLDTLQHLLYQQGITYEEFIFSLGH